MPILDFWFASVFSAEALSFSAGNRVRSKIGKHGIMLAYAGKMPLVRGIFP